MIHPVRTETPQSIAIPMTLLITILPQAILNSLLLQEDDLIRVGWTADHGCGIAWKLTECTVFTGCFGSDAHGNKKACNLPFVAERFRNWKKAVGLKDSYLDQHGRSESHKQADVKTAAFLATRKPGTDILSKLQKQQSEQHVCTHKGILSISLISGADLGGGVLPAPPPPPFRAIMIREGTFSSISFSTDC